MPVDLVLAEIITIGDEILIGQVVDTNSSWIAQELNKTGIKVKQITSVSDDKKHIMDALIRASARADVIITTGGLGPTKDDKTKQSLCEYFKVPLKFDQGSFKNVGKIFSSRGLPVTDLNKKQAEIPLNCEPMPNRFGTAPGMWFQQNKKIYISVPGVPYEMKDIMEQSIIPRLKKSLTTPFIIHKTIMTTGIGESFLSEIISDFEDNLPSHIKLAYLPKTGIVRLRLSAIGKDNKRLTSEINQQVYKLQKLIPQYIYGYDDDALEQVIGSLLINNKQTLGTAESCTGGYMAHLITSVPGSSRYYKGSIIAYDNGIKNSILGVERGIIEKHGAVSKECVTAMAESAIGILQTDYVISCSGIAGPDGGTNEKPVGTIWIAVASEKKTVTDKLNLNENRERNIHKSAINGLNLLRKLLINKW